MSKILKAKVKKTQKEFDLKRNDILEVQLSHFDPIYNQNTYTVLGKDFWLPEEDLKFIE